MVKLPILVTTLGPNQWLCVAKQTLNLMKGFSWLAEALFLQKFQSLRPLVQISKSLDLVNVFQLFFEIGVV